MSRVLRDRGFARLERLPRRDNETARREDAPTPAPRIPDEIYQRLNRKFS